MLHSRVVLLAACLAACSGQLSGPTVEGGAMDDLAWSSPPDLSVGPDLSCNADIQNDPANCGACGHGCQGGGCVAGLCQPVTLVPMQNNPWALAVDNTDVYWLAQGASATGTLSRAAKADGAGAAVISSGYRDPWEVAVDAVNVYWSNKGDSTNTGMSIMMMPKSLATAAVQIASPTYPTALAVDPTSVYWASYLTTHYGIQKYPISGGSPTEFTPVPPATSNGFDVSIIIADDLYVYFNASSFDPTSCGMNCYGGGISRLPRSGGTTLTNIVVRTELVRGMALRGSDVYYISYHITTDKSDIKRVNKMGGPPATVVAGIDARDLVADDAFVYFVDGVGVGTGGNGGVWKVPTAGGAPIALTTNQAGPSRITADALSLYWLNYGTATANPYVFVGAVMKLAK